LNPKYILNLGGSGIGDLNVQSNFGVIDMTTPNNNNIYISNGGSSIASNAQFTLANGYISLRPARTSGQGLTLEQTANSNIKLSADTSIGSIDLIFSTSLTGSVVLQGNTINNGRVKAAPDGYTVRIQNVATPITGSDAVTKTYVDNSSWKQTVRVNDTNGFLASGFSYNAGTDQWTNGSAGQTNFGGVSCDLGDRILANNTISGSGRGIWVISQVTAPTTLTRAPDFLTFGSTKYQGQIAIGNTVYISDGGGGVPGLYVLTNYTTPASLLTSDFTWTKIA
jgi:hypothetical protein